MYAVHWPAYCRGRKDMENGKLADIKEIAPHQIHAR